MKISWGYIITAAYIFFVAGIVFLVIKASRENTDLVTPGYYEAELKYQEVIDQSSLTAQLSAPLTIEKTKEQVSIGFPGEFSNKKINGEIYLYCPSDAKRDFRIKFESDHTTVNQALPAGMSGLFVLKLKWQSENKNYYYEKKLFF